MKLEVRHLCAVRAPPAPPPGEALSSQGAGGGEGRGARGSGRRKEEGSSKSGLWSPRAPPYALCSSEFCNWEEIGWVGFEEVTGKQDVREDKQLTCV